MKSIFFLSFSFLSWLSYTGRETFINPTGTYLLKGEVKESRIVGHSGELRVRMLDTNTVALCFYINKGYPGYESGALMDTLHYEDNRTVYHPSNDSSCDIYFAFEAQSVEVFQVYTDPHSGCGFGPGVIIPAIFGKTSSEAPVIQDLSIHGSL
jgi:hypothetical protein